MNFGNGSNGNRASEIKDCSDKCGTSLKEYRIGSFEIFMKNQQYLLVETV